jgi:DNA helicase HerA-like ATPase
MHDHDSAAHSIDGHWFRFTAAIGTGLAPGSYVQLDTGGERSYLGQILEVEAGDTGPVVSSIAGLGAIRATIESGDVTGDPATPFGSATVAPVEPAIVEAHFARSLGKKAGLEIGTLRRVVGGPPATLQAAGFGRHTFICGQSGSGKTYTLGVILERLLLQTDLRIAVLDPNSDYVRLGELREPDEIGIQPAAHAALADRYHKAVSGLYVNGMSPDEKPLRSRFGRLSPRQQAAVLDLHPLRDAGEYNAFRRIVRGLGTSEYTLSDVRELAATTFDDDSRRLALRIDNLDVEDLAIWAPTGEPAMTDLVPHDWRAIVFDLGSLPSSDERSMMAASVVAYFWEARRDRQPTLLVIDEAHNICPQTPADRFQAMASDHLAAIAGEGRKFGLYLLLVTQRPQKVHVNVLSQCENLILMRMNSASDIEHLAASFSHVPAPLVRQAAAFGLGEGLAAGRIVADPMLFKTGHRYSAEGGDDIPTTWAKSR